MTRRMRDALRRRRGPTVKAVDVFCGAGGASLGLHHAGYDVIGYDHWPTAVDTHNANGLEAHVLDLSAADPPGPCDLLWGSPPCQPYSAAGDGEGSDDDRDGIPWYLRIVARLLPPVTIMENVKGLTFEKHAHVLHRVHVELLRLGYSVEGRVLNCADYGVPQTRERLFLIARSDGGPIVWPTVTHTEQAGMFTERWVSMADALGGGNASGGFRLHPAGLNTRTLNGIMSVDGPAPTVTTVPGQWTWQPARTVCGNRGPRWAYDGPVRPALEVAA